MFVCLSVFSFFAFTELRTSMAGKVLPHGKYIQKCFSGVYSPTGVWPNLYKHSARTKTNNWPRMLFPTNQFVQMAQMKHFPCVQVRVVSIECCLYFSWICSLLILCFFQLFPSHWLCLSYSLPTWVQRQWSGCLFTMWGRNSCQTMEYHGFSLRGGSSSFLFV